MAKLPVSIIVIFFNREPSKMPDNYDPDMLKDCIDSVVRNTDNFELITLDNGSETDESWIKEFSDKHIRWETNQGISNGWNKGIQEATHEHIIQLNDDTIVPPGWVEAMLEAIKQPQAGFSAPHVEGMPYGEGIKETWSWFPGACYMTTKKVIEKVGYFDWKTFFPCNWEDADMWVRVMAHGLKLYTNYAVTVQHRQGATLHVQDLSSPFEILRRKFITKHGFDCQDYLYGDKDIRKVLSSVDKIKIEPKMI